MKLNNNGWGYRMFIFLMCTLSIFLVVANHYAWIFEAFVRTK